MKIIVGKTNTVWGVIVRPQSSNAYRNILSFKDLATKDAFINKHVFQDEDHKALLETEKDQAIPYVDSLRINFRKQVLAPETFESMLGKDFAVLKDTSTNPATYKYYAIQSATRKGNLVEYRAELDIFFTYDITKDIFNANSQVMISRGMVDRVWKLGDKYHWFLNGLNINYKNPILNPESFDNISENGLIPADTPKEIYFDYKEHIAPANQKYLKLINKCLNGLKWEIAGSKSDKDFEMFVGKSQNREPYSIISSLAYITYGIEDMEIFRLLNDINVNVSDLDYSFEIADEADISRTITHDYTHFKLDSATLIKSSRTQTFIAPWFNNDGFLNINNFEIIPEINGDKLTIRTVFKVPTAEFDKANALSPSSGSNFRKIENTDFGVNIFTQAENHDGKNIHVMYFNITHLTTNKHKFTSDIKIIPDAPTAMSINDIVKDKHINEIKSYLSPYRFLKLKTISESSKSLAPEIFTDNSKYEAYMSYMYLLETWQTRINTLHYLNQYNDLDLEHPAIDTRENISFIDTQTYQLATAVNAYEEWVIRNKSQFQSGMLNNKVNAGMGALGSLAGAGSSAMGGNAMGALGAVFGGLSLAVNSALKVNQQMSMLKDLKRTPNEIKANGSSLIGETVDKYFSASITEYKLPPNLDILVKEHFYKYGYELNNKLEDIHKYLNSRYYFNYIEAPETFENIKLQVSAEAKQIINDSLANGLTVWHVRDINTFKGIKNYDYENLEMSVI